MPEANDLALAVAELDDGYLQAQLLLAVGRASREEPRRAGFWHALAAVLAVEQQRRRQRAELTGADAPEEPASGGMASVLEHLRDELRRDAETLDAQWADAIGEFPTPAGQAPLVQPDVAQADGEAAPTPAE